MTDIQSDLDKLIYTMKNLHTTTEVSQFPKFWNEEWLRKAISEVDLRAMTPEQKLAYEMTLSANALAVKNENKRIEQSKVKTIQNALKKGLNIDLIAEISEVSVDFVKNIQQKMIV